MKESPQAELPDLDWGDHLIESLFEFGPAIQGEGGISPVTFQEMESWSRMTKLEIPGYEAELLKKLSRDYVSQYRKSIDPNCPIPSDNEEEMRAMVSEGFKSLLRAHKR